MRAALHGFDRIADQVEENLLNLHLLHEDGARPRIEAENGFNTLLLGADKGQGAGFFDELIDALRPPLRLAARHEFAQAADDLACAQRLVRGLGQGIVNLLRVRMLDTLDQSAAALQIVGDGRQRLIDLVRERRGHLAHGGEPRQARQFRLQLFELPLGRLALGQVTDEAGKEATIAGPHLSDLELHGKGRVVLALACDDAVDADNPLLAGREVTGDIAVMLFAKSVGMSILTFSPTTWAWR